MLCEIVLILTLVVLTVPIRAKRIVQLAFVLLVQVIVLNVISPVVASCVILVARSYIRCVVGVSAWVIQVAMEPVGQILLLNVEVECHRLVDLLLSEKPLF